MKRGEDAILVSGATGQQGGAVARELLANGHRVKAMTRNPDSAAAKALADLGAGIVQADLDDAASLDRVLRGAWGVFSVQNTWEAGVDNEEVQGKRIAERAKEAGVQHFVYTSVGSAHRETGIPHFDNKWRIEETIRGLGLPSFTILRPVFFMENLLSPWFKPAIDEGKLTVGVQPKTRLQMIAVKDIGRYGAAAFEMHDKLNGRSIDIAGDELTMPQAAEIVSRATGKKVVFEPTPIEEVRQFSADFAVMLEWFDRVGYNAVVAENGNQLGVAPTRFEQWATKEAKWA